MKRMVIGCSLTLIALTITVAAGCGSGDDSNSDEQLAAFADGVKAVDSMRKKIKDAFETDDTETAHGPLHDIGDAIEKLNDLAKKAEMSDKDQQAVSGAVENLMDSFGKIDDTLHGREGSTYADEEQQIDAAMKVLLEKAAN